MKYNQKKIQKLYHSNDKYGVGSVVWLVEWLCSRHKALVSHLA